MLKRVRAALVSHWLTIRVVATFVILITLFFSLLTYTPIVKRVDVVKYSAGLKAKKLAMTLAGNTSCRVLNCITVSL